jgi:mRNA-degrading endonuclease RelE of RelBE toxin-antitoxin system
LTFSLVLWHELSDEINRLPEKSRRIIKTALKRLEEDPFPGSQGDKEKLVLRGGVVIYRLHISRRYTAFYDIDKEEKLVIVQEILPIEQAHKKYGYWLCRIPLRE